MADSAGTSFAIGGMVLGKAQMTSLPSGMVTFLLTDIEGSSRLWETDSEGMGKALAEHDRLLRQAISAHDGHVFATAGDSIAAAFHNVTDAINAATNAQLAMADLKVGAEPVRVRMAIHAGKAEQRDGDYFGQVLNRCGRLRDAAHGGQVLLSRVVYELLREAGLNESSLFDLGEHRLRDLEQPEGIFQLAHPDLESDFPPLRTLTKATTNFPVQLTSFVGREQELEEVAKLVRSSRLVTLTGVGGTGKTRLAMQVAAALASELADGVWLVDLAPISEPELVVEQVAAVFRVRTQANRSLLESLVEQLRSRQAMVVLDNCEHIIDEACRVTVTLLSGTQNLRIIATSRESLHVPGEVSYVVPPLGLPGPRQQLDRQTVERYDAVRLFAARAETTRRGFRLTEDSVDSVLEICRRLDGIPLAIELAAARLSSFTPKQIAGHLDQRFRLLSAGRRGGLPRHETLQATIDWSYALLTDLERMLFDRLAVFRSDFSLEAAQRILGGNGLDELDLLEVLPRLIDKSLVVAEPREGEMRYLLLETIRQYASERWEVTEERSTFERRHAHYFLQLAEDGYADLRGSKHEEVLDRLRMEHDNLRQTLRWSLDNGELDTGMRLAGALYRFWLFNDKHSEGAWWLESFLSRGSGVPDSIRARALLGLGTLSGETLGNRQSGITALRQSVDLYRSLTDETTRLDYATALNNLAADLLSVGDLDGAEACYEEALQIARFLDVQWGVALVLWNMGRVAALQGRVEPARVLFDQGVDEARKVGSARVLGDALWFKARFEHEFGTPQMAVAAFDESIRCFEGAGHLSSAHWATADMAISLSRLNDPEAALELFLTNSAAALEEQKAGYQAMALVDLALGRGEIDIAVGAFDQAAQLLGFVDRLIEAGEFNDFVARHRRLRAETEVAIETERFYEALTRGRSMVVEEALHLITTRQELTL